MRTFLRFLKPYQGLCLLTLLVMALDVAGALYLPTIVADMINIGVAGGDLDFILRKGGLMLGVALVSGGGTLVGCFLCARLSARIGRDMRNALYDKSLTFSASDFEGFGTGSMITRTLNDVNVVQQAFVWSVQMVLPVPLMCVIGVLMAFSIDHVMGLLLIGITLVVILGAVLVTRRASAIFARAQRFLDRISVVVRENITGARVIRAFNKAPGEAGRMRRSFTDYAQAAIQANTLFFVLESPGHLLSEPLRGGHPLAGGQPHRRGLYGDRGHHRPDRVRGAHPLLCDDGPDGPHAPAPGQGLPGAD